jgi:hypothetical protein
VKCLKAFVWTIIHSPRLRDGRTIPVPPGPRGVRLESGDEITLGEARPHVEIETVPVR